MTMQRLPLTLAFTGGYVDTVGFLTLQGLFTAHVTGNFVTLGATFVTGASGVLSKLLALPVFCVVIALVRLLGHALKSRRLPELRILMMVKLVALTVGAAIAMRFGPFHNGDSLPAIGLGMVLVTAMAVQNAAHRLYLTSSPPTTLMTGNTTQMVIDVIDWLVGVPVDRRPAVVTRLGRMASSVLIFAIGCGAGALLYARGGMASFALPPFLAFATLFLKIEA